MVLLVRVAKLGRLPFREALRIQNNVVSQVLSDIKNNTIRRNTILLVEHYPIYTVGLRSTQYLQDEPRLRSLGADFMKINRGGLITFHGIGQLTVYPILYIGDFLKSKSLKLYVNYLENVIIGMLNKIILNKKVSTLKDYPGVWINEEKKIATIGINVKRYVTSHGAAINCNLDLKWFNYIIPCGIKDKEVTSITNELEREFTIDNAIPLFLESFKEIFKCNLLYCSIDDIKANDKTIK